MSSLFLYKDQQDALKRMKNGCILVGGTGSGKSRTSLAYYFFKQGAIVGDTYIPPKNRDIKDLYIITTARKRDTQDWEKEMLPFAVSNDDDLNYYTNKVVIDSWNNIKKYINVKNAFFIFDEQRVVGYGAWSKSFIKIAKQNEWILLSATPADSWMDYIPVFIANGFYRTKTEFTREHVVFSPWTKYPKPIRYLSTGKLIKYRNSILVRMDYRNKAEQHHENIYVLYDQREYKDIWRFRIDPFKDEPIANASSLCFVLRKSVNSHPSRLMSVIDILEEKRKAIIFYNFDYELEILQTLYKIDGLDVAEWNGHNHDPIPNSNHWAYLVQYTAGAEGWNCIETDTVIFYSPTYSYRTMVQASGRIDRRNTPFKDLYYYHLISRSGIDIAINRAISNKKSFNEAAFININHF